MKHRRPTECGFTLIEVMIALAVIAIGLLAVVAVAGRSSTIQADLESRAFAQWIAANKLSELRLSPQWPKIGVSDDDLTFGGRKWHWKVTIAGTPDTDLRRATVSVALAASPNQPVTQLVGFIGRPNPEPVQPPHAMAPAPRTTSP